MTKLKKNFWTKKKIDFDTFVYTHVMKYSESISTKRIFDPKFVTSPFFRHLDQNLISVRKNILKRKIFWWHVLKFKIRLEIVRIDSDQKNRSRFFVFAICLFLPKRYLSPRRTIVTDKIFYYQIFVLEYVFKHSKSIVTKKITGHKYLTRPFSPSDII